MLSADITKEDLKWQSHLHGEGRKNQRSMTDAKIMNELNKSVVAGYPNQQVMRILPDQPAIVPSFGYNVRQFAEGRAGIGQRMSAAKAKHDQMLRQNASNFAKDSNNSSSIVSSFTDLLQTKNVTQGKNNFSTSRYAQRKKALNAIINS